METPSPAWRSTWPMNGPGQWGRAASSMGGCVLVIASKPSTYPALPILGHVRLDLSSSSPGLPCVEGGRLHCRGGVECSSETWPVR